MYCYITLLAWIFLCLHQAICNSGVNPCTPKAKQGASYTISSSVDAVEEFKWKTYNASGMTTRSRCFISSNGKPVCVDEYPFCHAEVKAMNGIYQMTLTIPTVVGKADDNVIWVWGTGSDVDFKELGRCKMEVNYPCDPPAKLGLPYTFKHTVKTMKHFRWRKQEGDIGYSTISTCYQDTNTRRLVCDDRSSIYHAEVQMLDDGSYSLTLTIPNVYEKRDLDSWIWENGDPDSYKELGSCDLTLYYPCPTPAKQGSPYTFTQHVSTLTNFVWSVKNSMTHCHIDETKQAICEVESTIYDGEVEKEYKSYKLSLNINSVARPRDEGVWSWKEGPEGRLIETGRCDLKVYYYESAPTCNKLRVENTGTKSDPSYSVVWSCTISKFYPTPSCLFQYKKHGKGNSNVMVKSKYVTEGTPVSSGNIVYYSKECSISVPLTAALFSPGKYKFKVIMYPTLVGLDQETELSIGTSTESSDLDLVLPRATVRNCPYGNRYVVGLGYIKAGTKTATCQCQLTRDDIGNPPGWIDWFDSNGNSVGNFDAYGTVITLSDNDTSPHFTCRSSSHLGKGNDVLYTPKFAYGPKSSIGINLTINGKSGNSTFPFEDDTDTYSVVCDVPFFDVNPSFKFQLSTSDHSKRTEKPLKKTKTGWQKKWYLNPSSYGRRSAFGKRKITCSVYNTVFKALKISKTGYVDIVKEESDELKYALGIPFGIVFGIILCVGTVFGCSFIVKWWKQNRKEIGDTPEQFDNCAKDDDNVSTENETTNTYVDLDNLPKPAHISDPLDHYDVITDC